MAGQEKHGDRMLQRTLELQRFPIGSAPMCIRVPFEDKVATPSKRKQWIKKNAIVPEEIGAGGFSDGRHAVKNGHLMNSGPLGHCDDPDCVDCPSAYKNRMLFQRRSYPLDNEIPLFTLKNCALSDAICDKLKQSLYISGTDILCEGNPVEKIVFVVRGKLETIGADGSRTSFNEEAVYGAELLSWYLEQSLVKRDGNPEIRWMSTRTVRCLTNVEAFVLQASDLEEAILQFSTSLRNALVVAAIRYGSPTWKTVAASHIQLMWRYRQSRLKRAAALKG